MAQRARERGDSDRRSGENSGFLGEVHASGGGSLWLTRLFGISDPAATFYCAEYSSLNGATPAGPRPSQIKQL